MWSQRVRHNLKRLNNNNNWIHSLQRPRIGWSTDFQLKFQGNSVGFVFLTNDAEIYATTQISHKNIMRKKKYIYIYIMPSEKSRNKRTHILLSHLHDMPRKGKFMGTESRLVVAWVWGWERGVSSSGRKVSC